MPASIGDRAEAQSFLDTEDCVMTGRPLRNEMLLGLRRSTKREEAEDKEISAMPSVQVCQPLRQAALPAGPLLNKHCERLHVQAGDTDPTALGTMQKLQASPSGRAPIMDSPVTEKGLLNDKHLLRML